MVRNIYDCVGMAYLIGGNFLEDGKASGLESLECETGYTPQNKIVIPPPPTHIRSKIA